MELACPGTFSPARLTSLTIIIILADIGVSVIIIILTDIGVSVIIIFDLFITVARVSMVTVCTLMKKLRE